MSEADEYEYWRNALEGRFGPIHEGDVQLGFYRRRLLPGKSAPWAAVAIYRGAGGEIAALQNRIVVNRPTHLDPTDAWMGCATHPIPEEVYRAVAENDQPWPTGIESYSLKRATA